MSNQNIVGPPAPPTGPPMPPGPPASNGPAGPYQGLPFSQGPPNHKEAKAQAKASKAYAKASRPIYKKKRFIIPVLLVVVIGIIVVATKAGGGKTEAVAASTCAGKTYPDQQPDDVCANAAGSVAVGDFTVVAEPMKKSTDGLGQATLCTKATLTNTADKSQDYNVLDFSFQSPSGNVATMSSLNLASTLSSGTLVAEGKKTGLVCTDDPGEKGTYIVIFKPNLFSAERGIWQFKV